MCTNQNILTCGHSNRSFDELSQILTDNGVTLFVDIRSKPYSRWFPHFNKNNLESCLPMQYVWESDLGGLAPVPIDDFEKAIERLVRYSKRYLVCIVCSEKDPNKCHRSEIIQPVLEKRGINVLHI